MASKMLMQLQDFLCQAEVTALFSNIHKLHRSKLEEALRIRGLSLKGDESILRVRLLCFEVQFFHPEIQIPWHDGRNNKLSKEEAINLQIRVDALRDVTKTLCVESTDDATPQHDAQTTHADIDILEKSMTFTDASVTSDNSHHKDNNAENQVKYRLNCVKLLKVCNLQYTGEKGLPAQDFLENLYDFRKFSKIKERVLLEILACVFDIDTKKWYRANNFSDWQSFEQKFVEDYVRLKKDAKKQTTDRATQTDNSSSDETRNRVVVPMKKSIVIRMPVSKTLQDLKDSLSGIGFKSTDSIITSKKSNIPTDVSSNSEVKASVPSKINATTRQTSNSNETMDGCSSTLSFTSTLNTPTASSPTSQSSINVELKNNSSLASTDSDKTEGTCQRLTPMVNTKIATQSSINPQSNAVPSYNNFIGSNEILTIAVNPAIPNLAPNSNKPNQVDNKSQAVVSQNNTPANYTTPISNTQSNNNNNVVTSVNQGHVMYHAKPIDSQSLSSTNAPSTGGCYMYAHHDCNASNMGQEYLKNQPLNYGFGTFHYPRDYYMRNGFRHC